MSRGCLFVPNNDYLRRYGGNLNFEGVYIDTWCIWTLFYLIPILDFAHDVVGIVGWDAQNKFLVATGEAVGLPMYKISSKNIFDKEKYFLTDVALLRRCFSQSVVFVTDGVFDSMALNYRGLPSISLLGSIVSKELIYFLSWYKYIYIMADNDTAGLELYRKLKRIFPSAYRVIQSKTKDIEELLRTESYDGEYTKQLRNLLENPIKGDLILK